MRKKRPNSLQCTAVLWIVPLIPRDRPQINAPVRERCHDELSPEAALTLADDGSPVFVARAMNAVGSMFLDVQKVAAAFPGNGALARGEHHPCLFCARPFG